MPPPPPPGATLNEDAAVLRPMQPDSTWTYEAESSRRPAKWRIQVSQSALNEGVSETARTSDGGVSYHPLAYRHGDVVQYDGCELFGGMTTCDEWAELRSPVQVGDQIELVDVDEYSAAFGTRGIPSRLEYVVYRRVVGEELVSLPELGSVRAVRVDTVLRQRITEVAGQGQQWLVDATASAWYAPGIGIVRRHFDVATSRFGSGWTEDQRLMSWHVANPTSATTNPR
ncbi:hypothetical protein [Ideonella sp. YS5]|uniref:hypothetical protein n=1 Tax=Ideonella sp. YS5 TaxID=3453714 RepID=UPI003EE8B3C9